ncbi:hypothetical protein CARUB_v10021644mg [Capsella rubella]|uniref:Zinc finger PHD-type domain-containing protein n=1 Tax=Capsella rubella TaxID=81985 RepID=R0GEB5_9BRAS|nr:uncharacterized protein LOC17894171 [Capsella rubella]EOA34142.1 hypothetical protein CARUB_v10021644mg [Capsella rubella]
MDPTPVKLPIHDHPLFPTALFTGGSCRGCHVNEDMYGGYFCPKLGCSATFHKECGEAPLEISHRSHPQHPLMLTHDDSGESPCDFCGQKLLPPYYSCSTCHFKVDLICGVKPLPTTIEHPMCHEHPLVFLKTQEDNILCEFCKESIRGPSYACLGCYVYFHVDCVNLSKEVNHPCHSSHPLKLIVSDTLLDDAEKSCLICEKAKGLVYHCSICNFTSCVSCTKNPPPLVIEHTKTHEHPLTRFSKRISYTCDVCGLAGMTSLYICAQCDFVIHINCIGFPRVVNINRHEHHISFTYHPRTGYSRCGVCRQYISQYKGAYYCLVCPNYAVHFMCAIKFSGWDGIDYEGTPDEIIEDVSAYKVVGDNLICHFSHEIHPLKLHKEYIIHDDHKRCEGCIHPLGFGSIYVCEECGFFLHEKCANLPMKKKFVFDYLKYTLKAVRGVSYCKFCNTLSGGFKYTAQGRVDIDVHCGSLSEPFVHDGHIHPLYIQVVQAICGGCNNKIYGCAMRCDNHDFTLCLYCASLPGKIWHKNDDAHPLSLCCGEKASIKYWCDICEGELDPNVWFYTCYDCGVTLHTYCVLGDFSRLMPGQLIYSMGIILEVVLNNHNTRLLCSQCHCRSKVSVMLRDCKKYNEYICSGSCLSRFLGSPSS